MKRQIEHDDYRLFKRQKTPEELGKQLIYTAELYQGKLQHISSNSFYVSQSFLGSYANDFLLNFCDSIGTVPPQIKSVVAEKFELARKAPVNTNVLGRKESDDNPHLCCWEFCLLALKDTGLVSKEQIDNLCYIIYTINEQNTKEIEDDSNKQLTLADALFDPNGAYKSYSPGNLPSPGDILIYRKLEPIFCENPQEDEYPYQCSLATSTEVQKGTESRPYHCSIATDNKGSNIGLDSEEEYVKKKDFTKLGSLKEGYKFEGDEYSFGDDGFFLPDKIYYVPLEDALQNINNFLVTHQNILEHRDPALKKTEMEILQALVKNETQYDKLAQELLNGTNHQLSM